MITTFGVAGTCLHFTDGETEARGGWRTLLRAAELVPGRVTGPRALAQSPRAVGNCRALKPQEGAHLDAESQRQARRCPSRLSLFSGSAFVRFLQLQRLKNSQVKIKWCQHVSVRTSEPRNRDHRGSVPRAAGAKGCDSVIRCVVSFPRLLLLPRVFSFYPLLLCISCPTVGQELLKWT